MFDGRKQLSDGGVQDHTSKWEARHLLTVGNHSPVLLCGLQLSDCDPQHHCYFCAPAHLLPGCTASLDDQHTAAADSR